MLLPQLIILAGACTTVNRSDPELIHSLMTLFGWLWWVASADLLREKNIAGCLMTGADGVKLLPNWLTGQPNIVTTAVRTGLPYTVLLHAPKEEDIYRE